MKRKVVIILFLSFVVFLAGCVNQEQRSTMLTKSLPEGTELTVENNVGSISLLPADGGAQQVQAEIIASGSDVIALETFVADFVLNVVETDTGIEVTVDEPNKIAGVFSYTVNITVKSDEINKALVTNQVGTVSSQGFRGELNITNGTGSVMIEKQTGSLVIANEVGEVTVQDIAADNIVIINDVGSINLDTETTNGMLRTVGNTELSTVTGDITFRGNLGIGHSYMDTEIGNIDFSIPVDSSIDLTAEVINGSIYSQFGDAEGNDYSYYSGSEAQVDLAVDTGMIYINKIY